MSNSTDWTLKAIEMRLERVIDLAWGVMVKKKMVCPGKQKEIQEILAQVYTAGYDESRCTTRGTKPVLQIKDGKIIREFRSTVEAGRHVGVTKSMIAQVARGLKKSCRGYEWKYKN